MLNLLRIEPLELSLVRHKPAAPVSVYVVVALSCTSLSRVNQTVSFSTGNRSGKSHTNKTGNSRLTRFGIISNKP